MNFLRILIRVKGAASMTSKTKVLSVDDNQQNRRLIELSLNTHFEVVSSDGNDDFLELIERVRPDIILMDIMLEGKTGFNLCKQLKASEDNDNIIIIFVSALLTIEDKLKAYACGADDYICKPIDIVELNEKLKSVEKRIQEAESLATQCKQASNVAFTSMKNASELGLLIEFFTETLTLYTPEDLYKKLDEFFLQFDIKFSLEFRLDNDKIQFPVQTISPLELEVLIVGRSAQRIISFGNNILFNSQWCSILIKNLPIEDEAFVGRIRDHVATLLSIIDSRLMFIDSENKRTNEREKALESLSHTMTDSFSEIKEVFLNQESELLALLADLTRNMDKKALTMGLSEEQESDLLGLFEETKDQFNDVIGSSVVIDSKLSNIIRILSDIH